MTCPGYQIWLLGDQELELHSVVDLALILLYLNVKHIIIILKW